MEKSPLLKIKIEEPHKNFYELRDELLSKNQKFTEESLTLVPYYQLHLCSIASAGEASCSLSLVQKEKKRRRDQYSFISDEELENISGYLKMENIYDDIKKDFEYSKAEKWDTFNIRMKIWAKLVCMGNHIDFIHARIEECIGMVKICKTTPEGSLPPEICDEIIKDLSRCATFYPSSIKEYELREKIHNFHQYIFSFFPEEERRICMKEIIPDFFCTSDCFKALA
jgi:hypothetical protein